MYIAFDNLAEFKEFVEFCGFQKADQFKAGVIAAQGYDTRDLPADDSAAEETTPAAILANTSYVAGVESLAATPPAAPKRKRRTQAEMEADRVKAQAAIAAPLDNAPPEAQDVTTSGLGDGAAEAIAAALNETETPGDMTAYVAERAPVLGAETSAKDFLLRCQEFIKDKSLKTYMDLLAEIGIDAKAVATCSTGERGDILARIEWIEKHA